MVLPVAPAQISHSDIMAEFGHTANTQWKISADGAAYINFTPSTIIKESDFYGKSAQVINSLGAPNFNMYGYRPGLAISVFPERISAPEKVEAWTNPSVLLDGNTATRIDGNDFFGTGNFTVTNSFIDIFTGYLIIISATKDEPWEYLWRFYIQMDTTAGFEWATSNNPSAISNIKKLDLRIKTTGASFVCPGGGDVMNQRYRMHTAIVDPGEAYETSTRGDKALYYENFANGGMGEKLYGGNGIETFTISLWNNGVHTAGTPQLTLAQAQKWLTNRCTSVWELRDDEGSSCNSGFGDWHEFGMDLEFDYNGVTQQVNFNF